MSGVDYRGPGARGDAAGSLNEQGVWPAANSVEGAIVAARLARLRWALVDEATMLARVHKAHAEDHHHGVDPGCDITDVDLQALRHAANSLERAIRSLTRREV